MREHMVIAWGHTRVPQGLPPYGGWLFDKKYYRKCKCGFKATSKSKELVEQAMDTHLRARRGAATGS